MSTTKKKTPKKDLTGNTPLNREEFALLSKLVGEASESNKRLVEFALDLSTSQKALDEAETQYADEMAMNADIHAQLAPLFHRLPALRN